MDLVILVAGTATALVVIALIDALAGSQTVPRGNARPSGATGGEGDQARRGTIRDGLRSTRERLAGRLAAALGRDDDVDRYDRLEEALVGVDVGMTAARGIVERVRREVGAGDDAAMLATVRREMLAALRIGRRVVEAGEGPYVILVTGVNGVGKTTTVAKLAAQYRDAGRSVLLVAADTFRAAAADQLETWADRLGVGLVRHRDGGTPAAVVFDGMAAAVARGVDVVLVDTAGRLHTQRSLVEELRKLRRVISQAVPDAPQETLLVLDATTGQNALSQARTFVEAVDVTGIVLTKLDGTARGGIALAIAWELGIPITHVGVGEGPGDLRPFDPEEFVTAVLGAPGASPPPATELQP
jgi:fused signal recognition particle receptor